MNLENKLNPEQLRACKKIDGPVLILAGAGSGKTRTLTHRIAYMIDQGVEPWNILAITFTNKAAEEMRNRVDDIVGFGADRIWVATFHSTCVKILRRFIDRLGYDTDFTIYDADDQKSVVKKLCKEYGIDPKQIKEKTICNAISSNKNEMVSPEQFEAIAGVDWTLSRVALIYKHYEETLKKNNALDFDDLLLKTVELFKKNPEVLANYQKRFKYICVDEYQDTNTVQFELVRLLAGDNPNLCVVGDDDQSIYRFRGANIRNILDFEKTYPNAEVIKLEQNYRSTQNILNAANAVIANNVGRKNKSLWSDKGDGRKIHFRQLYTSKEEAEFVIEDICRKVREKEVRLSEVAILYRTNAQSRELEEQLLMNNVLYNIVGGQNFYGRKEIKDVLAYLKTIANGKDDVAVNRIINVPKRGIGDTSIGKAESYAAANGLTLFEAMCQAKDIPGLSRAADKMIDFTNMIKGIRTKIEDGYYDDLPEIIDDVLNETGYLDELRQGDEQEDKDRAGNVDELISKAAIYEQKYLDENPEAEAGPTLSEFLAEVSLVADIDMIDESADRVLLMTLHGAKGLEFKHVYIVGCEDGLFPGTGAINSPEKEDMEEERRLAYVGITRAMVDLTITCAKMRMLRGETSYNPVSQFVREIPANLLEGNMPKKSSIAEDYDSDMLPFAKKAFVKPVAVKASVNNKPYSFAQLTTGADFKNASTDYLEGDRVRHIKFGEGVVKAIEDNGGTKTVTVDFEKAGIRVLNAAFAKLVVVK